MANFNNIKTLKDLEGIKDQLDFGNTGDILWYEEQRKKLSQK